MKSFLGRVLVVFVVTTNFVVAQTNLTYNLKAGDQFKVQQIATQDIVQDMNGSKHEMKNLLEGDFTFTVNSANDSLYDITFKFDRFKMLSTSNLMGEIFNVNTLDSITEDDIQGKIFAQLVQTNLSMKMYKTGKIKSISGSEELIKQMVDAAGDFDDFTKEMMKESMREEFSNESLARSFEQMTYLYPTEKVIPGDTWKNSFEGEMSSENTWTLKALQNDHAQINGESTVLFTSNDSDIAMNLTGDMHSEVTTSLSTGFVNTMVTTSQVEGFSTMKSMNNLKVPTTITSNITFKVEKHVQ